ncbi:uncharacterized protein TRUGW13939_01035 [Talaromyces rugulosus]|uniref:Arrestin-like N-terminal domain-containing protein n=1 Tax=Talaromyces rugulosus TaxID=121627 RepID=A0A7H8QKD2_TALRU|nr:uncharacterized protein TRUGW13939_01035 [Talaromyces rugulosus]QKX53955.1 hypothetical protein TRUGW13939_01035 [Talaromyces rugulosus]
MPRTKKTGGPSLQIDVASPPSWTFIAGDTVIGTVFSRSAIVAPEATVTITLFGRVKTKITVRKSTGNGSRTEHYRGRWLLVGSETRQVLHRGPVHLATGSSDPLSWPFSITIPTRPVDSLARQSAGAKSFLPLNNIADHLLPGTFYSISDGWGSKKSEAFVEYYLESVFRYSRGNSSESHTATFPLNLQHPSATISPVPELQQTTFQLVVQTQRLLPGMKDEELTFKQKTQKFFHSSKVPTFGYIIELHSARVIQLEDPSPIPLVIRFSPNTAITSPSIQDTMQIIRLDWVRMTLKSTTSVIAPGNWSNSNTHDHAHSSEHDLGLPWIFGNLKNPVVFESAKGSQEVDVGKLLQLVLHPTALRAGNRPQVSGRTISPDFVTYSIKHEHSIEWQFLFTVADETNKKKTTTSVRIVPPIRNDPNPPEYSKKE